MAVINAFSSPPHVEQAQGISTNESQSTDNRIISESMNVNRRGNTCIDYVIGTEQTVGHKITLHELAQPT